MKKIIAAIIAFVIISITVAFVLSFDTIETIKVEKTEYGGYNIINKMKSNNTMNMSVSYSVKPLSDGVYHVKVNIDNQNFADSLSHQNRYYEGRNIRADLCITGTPIIEYAACLKTGKSDDTLYSSPRLSYYDDKITASFETEGSFVSLDMFVIGEFDLNDLNLTYDIKGKSIRLLNSFIDNSVQISLGA